MAVVPITATGEQEDPATSIDSPVGRLLRRPSERYRRERPRQLRYRLAVGIAEVVSRIVAWLPDGVRDGIADRAGEIWVRLTPAYRANVWLAVALTLVRGVPVLVDSVPYIRKGGKTAIAEPLVAPVSGRAGTPEG